MLTINPHLPDGYDAADFLAEGRTMPQLQLVEIDVSGPEQAAAEAEHQDEAEEQEDNGPFPMSASDLVVQYQELRAPLVRGLLRVTETCNLIAAPKMGKSWLGLDLALSVVTGGHWLGFACEKSSVLLIDNELHPQTLAYRIRTMAEAKGLAPEAYRTLDVLCIRGLGLDLYAISALLTHRKLRPGLVILDAYYRAVPEGVDENSNSDQTRLYNVIDAMAEQTGAAVLVIHHSSKGSQADKALTDVGAGAGAIARAADAHMILRQHEEEGCAVMEAACRSFAPLPPKGLRWTYPRWDQDSNLDVERLHGRRLHRKSGECTPADFASRYIIPDAKDQDTICWAAESDGISAAKARRLLHAAVVQGHAHQHQKPGGAGRRATFATVAPPETVSDHQRAVDYLTKHPKTSNKDTAVALSISEKTVQRARNGPGAVDRTRSIPPHTPHGHVHVHGQPGYGQESMSRGMSTALSTPELHSEAQRSFAEDVDIHGGMA